MDLTFLSVAQFGESDTGIGRQSFSYYVAWRQRKLVVAPFSKAGEAGTSKSCRFGMIEGDRNHISQCLRHSKASVVILDPELKENDVVFWADLCQQVGKRVHIRLGAKPDLPERARPLAWMVKVFLDRLVSLLLLTLLSPVILAIAILLYSTTRGSVFSRQWRVGRRGHLFQSLNFRSTYAMKGLCLSDIEVSQTGFHEMECDLRATTIARWLQRYGADKLPELINVLLGNMSLVGPRPRSIRDAVKTSSELRHCLNAMPGLTGVWSSDKHVIRPDLTELTNTELLYLCHWSLIGDFNHLVKTIPTVFSELGSY